MARKEYHYGEILNNQTGTVFISELPNNQHNQRMAIVKCGQCGREYSAVLASIIHRGSLCWECGHKNTAKKRTQYNNGDILNTKTGSKLIKKDVTNSMYGLVQCGHCGKKYHTWISPVTRGSLCSDCSNDIRSKASRKYRPGDIIVAKNGLRFLFLEEKPKINNLRRGKFVLIDKNNQYINTPFETAVSAISSGKINGKGMSAGELAVKNILNNLSITYQEQYSFSDCRGIKNGLLKFDFAIFLSNQKILLIEIDGEQHYKPIEYFGGKERLQRQQANDACKNNYVKKHDNLYLIRFSYKEINNINEALILNIIEKIERGDFSG